MGKIKKIFSIVLTFVILFSTSMNAFAKNSPTVISYNGYVIKVSQNDSSTVKVIYEEGNNKYTMTFNKSSRDINLIISNDNVFSKNITNDLASNNTYKVNISNADPSKEEISDFSIVSDNGKTYNFSSQMMQPMVAFAIPIGIALGEALIQALLLVAGAVIIGGVAYVIAEEAVAVIKKQKTYNYYDAVLRNDGVYIGNGISTNSAKGVMALNSRSTGVFATTASYARGLCASLGGYRYDPAHGASSGYWDHYHCNLYPKAHCWYAN
jgi:hypothetical protein